MKQVEIWTRRYCDRTGDSIVIERCFDLISFPWTISGGPLDGKLFDTLDKLIEAIEELP